MSHSLHSEISAHIVTSGLAVTGAVVNDAPALLALTKLARMVRKLMHSATSKYSGNATVCPDDDDDDNVRV